MFDCGGLILLALLCGLVYGVAARWVVGICVLIYFVTGAIGCCDLIMLCF